MKTKLRLEEFEDRLVPAIAIDTAYETYAWVFINTLRQNPTAFANNLDGLRTGAVNSAFGFSKTDPVITDLKSMISRASVPQHYGEALSLMRSTAPAGPLAWDETLENRAGVHNDWMKVNGFEHTGVSSGNRFAIPGFTRNNSAPADTWGYSGQFSWYGENIGYAVGSLSATKAAYNAGSLTMAGILQRAAFLDTVAYMLELNSGSLGHLENLLGRDSGTHPTLPLYNAIGLDTDLYEAPAGYEAQDGVPEAYLSTHRLGLYRPGGSGGFVTGLVFEDRNSNGFYDVGEGSSVTIDVRNASGSGFTNILSPTGFGAYAGYAANGTYTVTVTVGGVVLDSRSVTINNNNAWAGFTLTGLGRPTVTTPIGAQTTLRPTLVWSPVQGATGYEILVSDRTPGVTMVAGSTTGTSWSPTSDLVSGRWYRVWVRAMQGTSAGPWSEFKEFSVAIPTRSNPVGPTWNLRPTFEWTPIEGAVYQLRIDDVTGQRNNIFPNENILGTNWEPPADLVSGRVYRWQIRAVNSAGFGAWSPATNFAVARPVINGPTGVQFNLRPTFTWTSIDGATQYEVRVNDVTAGKINIFPATRVTGLTWTPSVDLISGRSYAWVVRAMNASSQGAWSVAGQFVIARPALSGPTGNITDRTPTFNWSTITGATSYQLVLINLTTGKNVAKLIVPGTSWTPESDLLPGHRYRWVVRAMNSSGLGGWSVYKDFSVI